MYPLSIDANKKYWFFLEPYVYPSLKNNYVLLYNTLSGDYVEYSNKEDICNIIKKLKTIKNLGTIEILGTQIKNSLELSEFFANASKFFMGGLIDKNCSSSKPIQLVPIPKVHKSVEFLSKKSKKIIGKDLLEYVHELQFYINSECDLNCNFCENGHKQFDCCSKMNIYNHCKQEMDIGFIEKQLNQTDNDYFRAISIKGGNILKYSNLLKLTNLLNDNDSHKLFYVNYLNIFESKDEILNLFNKPKFKMQILIDWNYNLEIIKKVIQKLSKFNNMVYELVFIVKSESDFNNILKACNDLSIVKFSFKPYFNGKNINFFKEYLFIEKEEIFAAKQDLNNIYNNKFINKVGFGKLIILNNNDVYANLNHSVLGNLNENSIHNLIYKELISKNSWRKTRNEVEPCNNCTYCELCPPLSNYEYFFNRNNLCSIKL